MKTFSWTVPEPRPSQAEEEAGGLRRNQLGDLSRGDLKFFDRWSKERELGRPAFRRKLILQACLGLSVITAAFLLAKLVGIISRETTLFQSAFLFGMVSNLAAALPSWKKNEKRYQELLDSIEDSVE